MRKGKHTMVPFD